MEQKIKEFPAFKVNGFIMLAVVVALTLLGGWYLWSSVQG
ncbi:MAG: SPFH domain-containing protein, partial [Scytonema sp. CRU_2_7]|nr:SPFH domain-containing protein [Scytonema sp. CRU_2_7]